MSEDIGTPAAAVRGPIERWSALGALIVGLLAVFGWMAGLVGLFMSMDTDENGLAATVALLVVVVLAAALTTPARSGGTVLAVMSAVLYAAIWAYLRVGFHRMMPDALLLMLTGIFFLAPLVTGIAAVVVGAKNVRK